MKPKQPLKAGKASAKGRTLPVWAVMAPLALAFAGLLLLGVSSERVSRGARRALASTAAPAPGAPVAVPPLLALPQSETPPSETPGRAKIAIVIDDVGYDLLTLRRLLATGMPLTFAVLPERPHSQEAASLVQAAGRELILHQPMEALPPALASASGGTMASAPDPGPGGVLLSMTALAVTAQVMGNLLAFPAVVGMNNHMGSAFTREPLAMEAALAPLVGSGRYFLDSRTTPDSVAFDVAQRLGLRVLRRDVFLDHEIDEKRIADRFEQLLHVAREEGRAVGIGHPHPETVSVLERLLPRLQGRGFALVPASRLARHESLEHHGVEQAVVEDHHQQVP